MKNFKALAIILIIVLSNSVFASDNKFDVALQKANKNNKEVLMMYSAVYCPECEYMKEVVLKDPKIANYIKQRFVVIIIDVDKDKLPKGFDHMGIPYFFVIDKSGKKIGEIIGGSKTDKFLKKLEAIK